MSKLKRNIIQFTYDIEEFIAEIKEELKQYIPSYMIPKKIIFIEKIPTNNNGKIDRKKLMELGDN